MKKIGIYTILREETYQSGQFIFSEDHPGDSIYIIIEGSVETTRGINKNKVVIERLQTGDIFGEAALIRGMKRIVTARAVGETTLGIIDQKTIKTEYEQLSKQFRSMIESIPLRLKKVLDQACDVTD
jgi:CRP-like cAMP-binding protein